MHALIKILLLNSFLIATSQTSADNISSNFELHVPTWGSNQAPIVWGDCIPVPFDPMNMPHANMPMRNNMPFPQAMTIPAPMYGIPNDPQFRIPPPNPFFNIVPVPEILTPDTQQNCNNNEEELQALQARYNDAASASRNKIAELSQALEDAQNQMSDSQKLVDKALTDENAQQERITELENKLKVAKENLKSLESKLDSTQSAATLKSVHNNEAMELLKKKLSDLESKNTTLKTQLSSAESNIGSQARMLTSLQQNASELTTIKSSYNERNDENIQLKDQLAKLENSYKTLQAQIEKVNTDASMQAKKLTVLGQSATELSALKGAYKERTDENAALKDKLTKLEKDKTNLLASLNSKKIAITLKSAQDNQVIAELKNKLSDSENNNTSLKKQLETAINNAGSQARKITTLGQSATELTAIRSAYKERSDENTKLKKKLFVCDSASKTLKGQLNLANSNAAEQARELIVLNQSVAELADLKSAYKERNEENAALKIKTNDIQSMQATIDASKAKVIELQNKLNESEGQRKTLVGKISTLEATSSDQARKITALMVTTSELDALKSAYKDLSSEKVELKTQLVAATADTDKDGVLDSSDKCPNSPEGSEVNSQGCPDIQDADNDGVADDNDLCPTSVSGTTVNGFGCAPTENITLKGVNFSTGSAKLTSDSLPIINAAAETLKQSPDLNIEIAGYTDNQGLSYVNKRLSQHRANSVMIQLIKQGIEAERLTANGYGEKVPIAGNGTEEGRATNRRVELKIRE